MKELPVLGLSRPALVDDEDYERVRGFVWTASRHRTGKIYVKTADKRNGKQRTVRLHRLIMGAATGQQVDHRNHDGLDNRKSELRLCSNQQNQFNRRKLRPKTSQYKGVFRRENGKWRACIRLNNKLINIGTYPTEALAAAAYNEKARVLFGEFALLNRVPKRLERAARQVVLRYSTQPLGESGYFGVVRGYCRKDGTQMWGVHYRLNGKETNGKYYADKREAAKAYNEIVISKNLGLKLNVL